LIIQSHVHDWDLSIFEFMHELWTFPVANITYIRLQKYTNRVVGKHEIQSFKIVIFMSLFLSFDDFVPKSAHPLLFSSKRFS
jgi:hypothetical protein